VSAEQLIDYCSVRCLPPAMHRRRSMQLITDRCNAAENDRCKAAEGMACRLLFRASVSYLEDVQRRDMGQRHVFRRV
jgi:hypothetical protein